MQNCWRRRTTMETAFLAMLIVAVPFSVIMLSFYIVLLLHHCPDCSILCSEYCDKMAVVDSDIFPMPSELRPNVSLSKLYQKYRICAKSALKDFHGEADCKFVAAILENVYVDDILEKRYLCTAAIITFSWVVTGSKCLQMNNGSLKLFNNMSVRAGSNFWAQGGSVHEVKQILLFDDKTPSTVAAIELKTEFPKFPTIRPIMLSETSKYQNFGVAEIYRWKTNDSDALKFRRKNVKLTADPMVVFKDVRCQHEAKQHPGIFCAESVKSTQDKCVYYTGFPVAKANILIGVDVGEYCNEKQNATVHLIYDIAYAIKWIVRLTGTYVEYL